MLTHADTGHGFKPDLIKARLGRYKHGAFGSAFVTMLEGVGSAAITGECPLAVAG